MKTTRNSTSVLNIVLLTLFVTIFVFFTYTFLHEAGHAIAGWLFGQSLTEFDASFWDLSAHVSLSGGALTQMQLAIQSAAGVLLPLVIWAIFISLVPHKGSFILEILKLISSMVVVNTLLAWIVLPILFLFGRAPSDDVTNFLNFSQMPPLLLSFTALVLYANCWLFFLSRIDGFRNELLMFSTTKINKLDGGTRTTVGVMTSIMAGCAILVFTLNLQAAGNLSARFSPPQGFARVVEIDLSARPYSSETVAWFTLDETSSAGVFIVVRNIDTTYFDLSVAGPDGSHSTVLHGEGYSASQDGGLWEKNLPSGTYRLVLTSAPSSGTATVYLNHNQP
jgi:hypothetical protein